MLTEGGHTLVVLCCSALLSAHLPPPQAEGVWVACLPVAAAAPHVLAFAVGAGAGAPENNLNLRYLASSRKYSSSASSTST